MPTYDFYEVTAGLNPNELSAINDRIDSIEQNTVRLVDYENDLNTITTRINEVNGYADYAVYTVENKCKPFDYDILVKEVLSKVVKIIERKSNWVFFLPEEEFNGDLEGLF